LLEIVDKVVRYSLASIVVEDESNARSTISTLQALGSRFKIQDSTQSFFVQCFGQRANVPKKVHSMAWYPTSLPCHFLYPM
jgi:hypothetical protein